MTFNLSTIKLHGMADFADAIEMFGTADGYSTQITELEHRRGKAQSRRTNHGNVVEDINKYDRRETHLQRRAEALADFEKGSLLDKIDALSCEDDSGHNDQPSDEDIGAEIPDEQEHHRISDRGKPIRLSNLFRLYANDPAVENFVPKLKDHILGRIYSTSTHFTSEQRQQVVINSDLIMQHATIGIKFTTYDSRRAQDTINPRSKHFFVMLPNGESDPDHPFWYAKVVGIYHINIQHHALRGGALSRINFLWVRWLELQTPGGWEVCRYDRVQYPTQSSVTDSFGFVDPVSIIRAAHLIPAFHYGHRPNCTTEIGADDPEDGDWNSYYVNRQLWEDNMVDKGDSDDLEFESETDCAPLSDSDDEYDNMLEDEDDL
ncbi:unnamed protein product [Rhizoctonia solani]|uniref:Uncharacterized protein n=1 Tax=Rhizoctonia solani TaxID=456999 RepID=A0A8H3BS51_9AGAM|nr:unnamed protein product [Rhizoctonia solani]